MDPDSEYEYYEEEEEIPYNEYTNKITSQQNKRFEKIYEDNPEISKKRRRIEKLID